MTTGAGAGALYLGAGEANDGNLDTDDRPIEMELREVLELVAEFFANCIVYTHRLEN